MRVRGASADTSRFAFPGMILVVCALVAVGGWMWAWAVGEVSGALDLQRHGVHVTAVVEADGSDPKNKSEQLSFALPDGSTAIYWSSRVTSQQAPGSTVSAVYLPGRPSTVESTGYLKWWWVGGVMMPLVGTAFILAGLGLIRLVVRVVRRGSRDDHDGRDPFPQSR